MASACTGLQRYFNEATLYNWPQPERWQNTWQGHGAQLRQFTQGSAPEHAPALCLIPSLINRAYILDLAPNSLVEALSQAAHIYVLDWGEPSHAMSQWGSSDYAKHIISPAWQHIASNHPHWHVLSHCMSGISTLAATTHSPTPPDSLILLSMPWDFSPLPITNFCTQSSIPKALTSWLNATSLVPPQCIQPWFYLGDSGIMRRKYADFATMPAGSAQAQHFLNIQSWVHDGVALTQAMAKECVQDWMQHNQPLPSLQPAIAQLTLPILSINGAYDRIVPSTSSAALHHLLPHLQQQLLPSGHIGMVAGDMVKNLSKTVENWLDI